LLRNWTLCYVGNLVGAALTAVGVHASGVCAAHTPVGATAIAIVDSKASLSWFEAFARGVFGNALVCLAVWLCFSARTTTDRILCIALPVCAFVAAGFEHSIANLYFVPLGIWLQADAGRDPAWQSLVNVVPVTLGNLVGGSCLVGLVYWFVYLRPRPPTPGSPIGTRTNCRDPGE
jgi:formate transporter